MPKQGSEAESFGGSAQGTFFLALLDLFWNDNNKNVSFKAAQATKKL